MKTKICLLLLCFTITSCDYKTYIWFQNKTDHDIQFYKRTIHDLQFQQNSFMKKSLLKNDPIQKYELKNLIEESYKVLPKDTIVFLTIIHGKKSKTELIDPNVSNRFDSFTIISNLDTIDSKEIIEKVNKVWLNKTNKTREVIWEFRDPVPLDL